MTTELADPKALSDVIKERLNAKVAEFLPDEVFDKLLEAAVADLVKPRQTRNSYEDKTPKLQVMIREEIEAQLNARIKEVLSGDEWTSKWDQDLGANVAEGVENFIRDHAFKIMGDFINQGVGFQVTTYLEKLRREGAY